MEKIQEITNENKKKKILNWCGFRFSKSREHISNYKVIVIIKKGGD